MICPAFIAYFPTRIVVPGAITFINANLIVIDLAIAAGGAFIIIIPIEFAVGPAIVVHQIAIIAIWSITARISTFFLVATGRWWHVVSIIASIIGVTIFIREVRVLACIPAFIVLPIAIIAIWSFAIIVPFIVPSGRWWHVVLTIASSRWWHITIIIATFVAIAFASACAIASVAATSISAITGISTAFAVITIIVATTWGWEDIISAIIVVPVVRWIFAFEPAGVVRPIAFVAIWCIAAIVIVTTIVAIITIIRAASVVSITIGLEEITFIVVDSEPLIWSTISSERNVLVDPIARNSAKSGVSVCRLPTEAHAPRLDTSDVPSSSVWVSDNSWTSTVTAVSNSLKSATASFWSRHAVDESVIFNRVHNVLGSV
jgi:hypothetical protein